MDEKEFKTLLFLECIKNQFTDSFLEKGVIRFGLPSEWAKIDGDSRGDYLEGAYAIKKSPSLNDIRRILSLRPNSTYKEKDGLTYFYSEDVTSMRTYCLYGLNDRDLVMNEKRSQDHLFHLSGKVPREYFENLYPRITKESYQSMPKEERPMLLMIRPDMFYKRLTQELLSVGLMEDEFIFAPVNYYDVNKGIPGVPMPYELFCKSDKYSEQHEIRVVITSLRPEIRSFFESNNGILELGPMKDITTLSEFYFDDICVEERGNKLNYSLATPIKYVLDETVENNLAIIQLALSDELPQSPMTIKEIEDYIQPIIEIIEGKFGARYNRVMHTVTISNGITYNFHSAAMKVLEHYNIYMLDHDLKGAKECIDKMKHFFPYIDTGDYFSSYYKAINSQ